MLRPWQDVSMHRDVLLVFKVAESGHCHSHVVGIAEVYRLLIAD